MAARKKRIMSAKQKAALAKGRAKLAALRRKKPIRRKKSVRRNPVKRSTARKSVARKTAPRKSVARRSLAKNPKKRKSAKKYYYIVGTSRRGTKLTRWYWTGRAFDDTKSKSKQYSSQSGAWKAAKNMVNRLPMEIISLRTGKFEAGKS